MSFLQGKKTSLEYNSNYIIKEIMTTLTDRDASMTVVETTEGTKKKKGQRRKE